MTRLSLVTSINGSVLSSMLQESPCSVAFEWRTKELCIQRSIDNVPISGEPEVEEIAENSKDTAPGHGEYLVATACINYTAFTKITVLKR